MKTKLSSLMPMTTSMAIACTAAVTSLMLPASDLHAQTGGATTPDGFVVRNDRIYQLRNGKAVPLDQERVLRIAPNGEITGFDGEKRRLNENTVLTMDGRILPAPPGTVFEAGQPLPNDPTAQGLVQDRFADRRADERVMTGENLSGLATAGATSAANAANENTNASSTSPTATTSANDQTDFANDANMNRTRGGGGGNMIDPVSGLPIVTDSGLGFNQGQQGQNSQIQIGSDRSAVMGQTNANNGTQNGSNSRTSPSNNAVTPNSNTTDVNGATTNTNPANPAQNSSFQPNQTQGQGQGQGQNMNQNSNQNQNYGLDQATTPQQRPVQHSVNPTGANSNSSINNNTSSGTSNHTNSTNPNGSNGNNNTNPNAGSGNSPNNPSNGNSGNNNGGTNSSGSSGTSTGTGTSTGSGSIGAGSSGGAGTSR